MKADTLIRKEGMSLLTKHLGLIESERFLMLMNRDSFDYTKWQESLFNDITIEEVFNAASKFND